MKNKILILFLSVTLFSCSDDEIYKGDSDRGNLDQGREYWIDAANNSTDNFLKYFFRDDNPAAPGYSYFISGIKWNLPNTIESGSDPDEIYHGFGYWMNPHAMDIVIDAYVRTGDTKYSDTFEPWLEGIGYWNGRNHWGNRYPNSLGLWNMFYDDMLWVALTTARIYDVTGNQRFWDTTMVLWNFIKSARNETNEFFGSYGNDLKVTGFKGMAWKWDAPYSRMSCGNGPGCLFAMKLYNIAMKEGRTEEAAEYLDYAKEVYKYMSTNLCDITSGKVFDHLNIKEGGNGEASGISTVPLSYNQGTFMGSALELYNATGEEEYLRNAISFGSYQVNYKMDTRYATFAGEGTGGDNLLFRGIFVRYLLDMIKQPKNQVYTEPIHRMFVKSLVSSSDVLWTMGRNPGRYFYQYEWFKAPTAGNRDDEAVCDISTNAQVPAATLVEVRARYENWAAGDTTEDGTY